MPATSVPDTTAPTNPRLPTETLGFVETSIEEPAVSLTADEWLSALHTAEIQDKQQQIRLRPWFAAAMFTVLVVQNVGIWFLVVWALNKSQLGELQLIFSALVAGSLTQSYFILRLITKKIFGDIDYHNGEST